MYILCRVVGRDAVLNDLVSFAGFVELPLALICDILCDQAYGNVARVGRALTYPSSARLRIGLDRLSCRAEVVAKALMMEAEHDRVVALGATVDARCDSV